MVSAFFNSIAEAISARTKPSPTVSENTVGYLYTQEEMDIAVLTYMRIENVLNGMKIVKHNDMECNNNDSDNDFEDH